MDRISIEGLQLRCVIGINPEEREAKQDVILDLTLFTDLGAAAASDDIRDTLNYQKLENQVRDFVEHSQFRLLEKLASEVARACLQAAAVEKVAVRIEKPGALHFARTVAIEMERTRNEHGDAVAP